MWKAGNCGPDTLPTMQSPPNMFNQPSVSQTSSPSSDWREASGEWEGENASPAPFPVGAGATTKLYRGTRSIAFGCHRSPGRRESDEHSGLRSFASLVFHRSGVKLRKAGCDEQIVTPLHISFHDAGEAFRCEALEDEGCVYDWLAVDPVLLRPLYAARRKIRGATDGQPVPGPVCIASRATLVAQSRLFAIGRSRTESYKSRQIDAIAFHLIARVLDDFAAMQARWRVAIGERIFPSYAHKLDEAQIFLARSYRENGSVLDIARRMRCSAGRLSSAFLTTTGFTIVEYRNELRMRKGLRLIEETGGAIGDVARQVGFCSGSHFTKAFRDCFGTPPSACLRSILA